MLEDLPWREVSGTQLTTVAGVEMLGILVADVDRVLAGQSAGRRARGRMNASMYGTPVHIAAKMVTGDLRDIAQAVEAYRVAHTDP